MGQEYVIRVNQDQIPKISELDEILKSLPHYYGVTRCDGSEAIEFRTQQTLDDISGMPDVSVSCCKRDIVICQFGDYKTTVLVLGFLVADFVSDAADEHVDVYMAGAESPGIER